MFAGQSRPGAVYAPSTKADLLRQIAKALDVRVDALCDPAETRVLHTSENGDRWMLLRDEGGRVVVRHVGNDASGGHVTDEGISAFLRRDVESPQHAALIDLIEKALTSHLAQ